jgi:hypothetical protein
MSGRAEYFTDLNRTKKNLSNPIVIKIVEAQKSGNKKEGNLQINGLWFKPVSDKDADGNLIPGAPPQSINISEENFVHKFPTLRTADASKLSSGHSRSIISISAIFTGRGIQEVLCPIVYSLNKFPLCFMENELLRKSLPGSPDEAIVGFVKSVNINTIPGLPETLQLSLQVIWFNHRPYVPRIRFRTKWFNTSTAVVAEKLKEIGRNDFRLKYGHTGIATNATIGNDYTEMIEEAMPLLHYLYEGYDQTVSLSQSEVVGSGYTLSTKDLKDSSLQFAFPIFQAPMVVRTISGEKVPINKTMEASGEAVRKVKPAPKKNGVNDPNFVSGELAVSPLTKTVSVKNSLAPKSLKGQRGTPLPSKPPVSNIKEEPPGDTPSQRRSKDYVSYWIDYWAAHYDVPVDVVETIVYLESRRRPDAANYTHHNVIRPLKAYTTDKGLPRPTYYNVFSGTSAAGLMQTLAGTYRASGKTWAGPTNLGVGCYKVKSTSRPYQYLTLTKAREKQGKKYVGKLEYIPSRLNAFPKLKEFFDAKANCTHQFDAKNSIEVGVKYLSDSARRGARNQRENGNKPLWTKSTVDWADVALSYHQGWGGMMKIKFNGASGEIVQKGENYKKYFSENRTRIAKQVAKRLKDSGSVVVSSKPVPSGEVAVSLQLAIAPGKVTNRYDKTDGRRIIEVMIRENELDPSTSDFRVRGPKSIGGPLAWRVIYTLTEDPTRIFTTISGNAKNPKIPEKGDIILRGQALGHPFDRTGGSSVRIYRVPPPVSQVGTDILYAQLPRFGQKSDNGNPVAKEIPSTELPDLSELEALKRSLKTRNPHINFDGLSTSQIIEAAKEQIILDRMKESQLKLTFNSDGKWISGGIERDISKAPTELEGLTYLVEQGWVIVKNEYTKKVAQYKKVNLPIPKSIGITTAIAFGFSNNGALTPMSGHTYPTMQHTGGKQRSATINIMFSGGKGLSSDSQSPEFNEGRAVFETFESLYKTYQTSAVQFREFSRAMPMQISNNLLGAFDFTHFFVDGLDAGTVTGRPFDLSLGLRLTSTKPFRESKPRLILQGEDSADLTLVKLMAELMHYEYIFMMPAVATTNLNPKTGSKENEKFEEWWDEAESSILGIDPTPSEGKVNFVAYTGTSFLHSKNWLKYIRPQSFAIGTTFNSVYPIRKMNDVFIGPKITLKEVKSNFASLKGYPVPKSGDGKVIENIFLKIHQRYKPASEWMLTRSRKDSYFTSNGPSDYFSKHGMTLEAASTQAAAFGFQANEIWRRVGDPSKRVSFEFFLEMFTNWSGVQGVDRLRWSNAAKKEILTMASYIASSKGKEAGCPGHEDIKAVLQGERSELPVDQHNGIYVDLALPPSPISGLSRDTNPDAFFLNDSDVTRCKPALYELVNSAVSPLLEEVKGLKSDIDNTEEALVDLIGTETTVGSLNYGGTVMDKGKPVRLYARPGGIERFRRSKVKPELVTGQSYKKPHDPALHKEGSVRSAKGSKRSTGFMRDKAKIIDDTSITVSKSHSISSYTNGTRSLEYSTETNKKELEAGAAPGSFRATPYSFDRGTFILNGNSQAVKEIVEKRNSPSAAAKTLHTQNIHTHDEQASHHLLAKSVEHSVNEEMALRRAFPGFQILFIEEDSPSSAMTMAFDDFYEVNAIESINVVHNKDHPGSTCTIQLLDLDGALYNRRYRLSEGQKGRLGIPERQIDAKGKPIESETVTDAPSRPFFSTMMKEGMKVMVKMGFCNNPEDLETLFIGQLVSFNQGARMTLVCQSYGTELVAQRFGTDPSENVDFYNANAGDVINAALNREEIRHFGRWKLESASISGRVTGHEELRPDGRIYSQYAWMETQSDDNIYYPDFSDAWSVYDKMWGHIQFVFYQTTVWEVLSEMTLRIPGHVCYPVPYGDRMTLFFGNPNQLYLYRPSSTNSERIEALRSDLEDPTVTYKWLKNTRPFGGADRSIGQVFFGWKFDSPMARQTVFDNLRHMHAIKRKKNVSNREELDALTDSDTKFTNDGVDVISGLNKAYFWHADKTVDHALRLSGRVPKIIELANKYGGIKNNKLPVGIPQGEFWKAIADTREDRVRPFRNYIYCTDFNHIISNNISCSKEGTFNSVELKYTDSDDVDFEEFNDGEDVTSIVINADDGIKEHHIRRMKRSFPNANCTEAAERYGSQLVANSLKDIYKGDLIMLGNPRLKPHDIIWINDVYSGISGAFDVKEVVHSFSPETGYTCNVQPHLIVNVSETVTEKFLQSSGRMFASLFGSQAALYTNSAGAIDLSEKLITGEAAERMKLLGVEGAQGDNVFISGDKRRNMSETDAAKMKAIESSANTVVGVRGGAAAIAAVYFSPIMAPIGLAIASYGIYKFVCYSSTREPVKITPLIKNNKPYILGIQGFENDTLMVSTGKKWKYFAEGWSDGADIASEVASNFFDSVFF